MLHFRRSIEDMTTCTEIAFRADGKDACVRIMMGPGKYGLKLIEVTQLTIQNGRLVYRSNDTMNFYAASIEDFYNQINEIDPEISL
ncbi:MAG: hypothetical protein EOP04_14150 [Proteobacteria bacterium]|nr:MAG: hypothetical protein EOP04_14150 [Pseudomonadota bacterium]